MEKKDLGTHVLSTTLTINTKYNQKELNYYLGGNGTPNIAVLISLTGESRKGTILIMQITNITVKSCIRVKIDRNPDF